MSAIPIKQKNAQNYMIKEQKEKIIELYFGIREHKCWNRQENIPV